MAILETYVKTLIEGKQQETVATYTATLPKKLQIGCYAKFLEGREYRINFYNKEFPESFKKYMGHKYFQIKSCHPDIYKTNNNSLCLSY